MLGTQYHLEPRNNVMTHRKSEDIYLIKVEHN